MSGGLLENQTRPLPYFASRQAAAGSPNTLWCISFTGVKPTLGWAKNIGDVDGSPIPFRVFIYVGTVAGNVYAYDTSGMELWSNTTLIDGPVGQSLQKPLKLGRARFGHHGRLGAAQEPTAGGS